MEEAALNTWEDFEVELIAIDNRFKERQRQNRRSSMEYPLCRGVGDSEYRLESTLDRIKREMQFSDYQTIIEIVREHVSTCTGGKWDLGKKEGEINLGKFKLPLLTYKFMAYLRHNGFPSPLIDWTKSPYIAAFFAFQDIYSKKEHVSIFVYTGKNFCGQNPCIRILGPTIATDRKHYLQQSEYSICVRAQGEGMCFANHEDVKDDEGENILIKYKIPASERQKVLMKLDSMNITAYSLFGSEPSLMETLALREIVLK